MTRKGEGPIFVYWSSKRNFNHGAMGDVSVRIFGNTNVTVTGGEAKLFVEGIIDNGSVTLLRKAINPPVQNVEWNQIGTQKNLAIGNHTLEMTSGIEWSWGNVDDTVTVSSLYEVTAAVPEPLTILGTGVVLGAIPILKKEYAKRNKKKDEDT